MSDMLDVGWSDSDCSDLGDARPGWSSSEAEVDPTDQLPALPAQPPLKVRKGQQVLTVGEKHLPSVTSIYRR
jgi:hypothetical protein